MKIEDRPRTDPSSVSDLELAKDLRPQTNWFQLDFRVETPCVQLREILSSINWSRLGSGPDFVSGIVSSIVWYRASYLDLYSLNMNLNKGRD